MRGFEIVTAYRDREINLPKRATNQAAGYDFEAAEDVVISSAWKVIWRAVVAQVKKHIVSSATASDSDLPDGWEAVLRPVLVPTGIKAYMQPDEYLQLTNRSSNPLKHFLVLPNGVGVVDADYYNNPNNEGHIFFQLSNFGLTDKHIKKGERIGQGIFLSFLKADQDQAAGDRTGGFGSSGHQRLE